MKRCIIICLLFLPFYKLYCQEETPAKRFSLTIGYLEAGGSYAGADLEYLLLKKTGVQVGLGYLGYEAGINFHMKPSIRSSFLSLKYWHQGVSDRFRQDAVGFTFNFRARSLIATQLGLGFPMRTGPAMPEEYVVPDIMLLYSIGLYFPF